MTDTPEDPKAVERARIREAADEIIDGIYFDLPAEIYHQVRRLSTSYLQKVDTSPADFWAASWLNPENDEVELDVDATDAQILGKAYHIARLEPHLFEATYCRAIERADFLPTRPDDAAPCWTGTDIEKALAELGRPKTKAGETVLEKAERLSAARSEDNVRTGCIYPLAVAAWEAASGKRIPIKGEYFDDILTDMIRIRQNPDIAALLSDGEAEVSIFWTDAHGLKMKTRLDYVRADGWADLKTFANPAGKRLDQIMREAMMYHRLYMQAVIQRDAIASIKGGNVHIVGDATEAQRDLIAALQLQDREYPLHFVFIQKDGIPNQLAKEFPFFTVPENIEDHWDSGASEAQVEAAHKATRVSTALHNVGKRSVTAAKQTFVTYSQVYQPGDAWFPIEPIGSFDDADFPPRFLDNN